MVASAWCRRHDLLTVGSPATGGRELSDVNRTRSASIAEQSAARRGAPWRGVVLVLISTAIFGSTPAVVTYLRGDMSLVDVISYRGIMAGAMLFVISAISDRWGRRSGRRPPLATTSWRVRNSGLVIGVVLYAPQLILFYTAFDYIDTSLAVALGYIYPTLVLLIIALRRRKAPPRSELVVSLVALLGIVALTNPGPDATVAVTGVVLVFAAAVLYALYVVVAGDLVADVPPLRVGGQVSGGVGLATVAYGIATGTLGLPSDLEEWADVIIQASMLVGAVATYYLGLVRLGSSRTSLIDTAQPVFALIAGGWLLGEHLAPVQLLGVGLVMLSVLATTLLAQRKPAIPFADPP